MRREYIKVSGDGTVTGTKIEAATADGTRVMLPGMRIELTVDAETERRIVKVVLRGDEKHDLDLSEYTGPIPGVVDVDEYNAVVMPSPPDES